MNISINELKKKKDNLLATYKKLHKKGQASTRTGRGSSEIYKLSWFSTSIDKSDYSAKWLVGSFNNALWLMHLPTIFDNDTPRAANHEQWRATLFPRCVRARRAIASHREPTRAMTSHAPWDLAFTRRHIYFVSWV